jgi:hypothetical protein
MGRHRWDIGSNQDCARGAFGDGPGFLPRYQAFDNQKIGEYVKF